MKSVKKYSKKKPRVQPRIQARSNKKHVNKKVSKKVNKKVSNGTKKVKRNKNKKLTKKNAQSGGLFGRNRPLVKESKVDTIFFDVDGTLGDTGCNGSMQRYDHKMYNDLLTLLKVLKKKGVKLFILTRCSAGKNICKKDQSEYYEPIVKTMDGVFAADVLGIDVNRPLPGEDNDMTWAAIKTMVMEEYCKSKNIPEEQKASVVLIDDDYRNARVAFEHGFRAFHNNKSRIVGAALRMTNNALKKILKEMGVRSKFGFKMKYDTSYFFDVNEILPEDLKKKRITQLGKEREDGIDGINDLITKFESSQDIDFKQKIKNSIEKSKKVICEINEMEVGTLVTIYEKTFNDNFVVVDIPSYTETGAKKVNLESLKLLGSDIYSSDNRFDFFETELDSNEIIIHWSETQKCFVVYFGLNNIKNKKNPDGVGFILGKKNSRTKIPSVQFNLSEEEIRQLKTRVVLMYDKEKLQQNKEKFEKMIKGNLSSEERLLLQRRLYQIETMLKNIDYANQTQSKIIIKIKRRQTPEVFSGFGSAAPPGPNDYPGFGNNEGAGNNEFGFGNNAPPAPPVTTGPNVVDIEGFGNDNESEEAEA